MSRGTETASLHRNGTTHSSRQPLYCFSSQSRTVGLDVTPCFEHNGASYKHVLDPNGPTLSFLLGFAVDKVPTKRTSSFAHTSQVGVRSMRVHAYRLHVTYQVSLQGLDRVGSPVFGDLALYLLEERGVVRRVEGMHPPPVACNAKIYLPLVGYGLQYAMI